MTDEQLIPYIAGFFDGEGTISLTRLIDRRVGKYHGNYDYRIIIAVGQNERKPLELLQARFSGAIYQQKLEKANRAFYSWQLTSRQTKTEFLQTVSPFLIVKNVKKRECEIGLAFLAGSVRSRWEKTGIQK